MGIAEPNLELVLFIIQTANIFLRTDKRIIGRKFDVVPFGFSVFLENVCFIWISRCVLQCWCESTYKVGFHVLTSICCYYTYAF